MELPHQFWEMMEHLMEVVRTETGFPVIVCDREGIIVRAADKSRIGDLHAGAQKIMQGAVDEYAVPAAEAAQDPLLREGYSCPIEIDGRRVAAFGITGRLDRTKPLARVAAKLIDAWIADQRHKEELEASEYKYRSIFDHSVQGIFQSTSEGRLLTANTALARMYGYGSPDELLAAMTDVTRKLYFNPGDRRRFLAQLQTSGRATGFLTQFKRRDGRIIDVRINAYFVWDPGTGHHIIEGIVEDITARRQAEEALKKSEEKFSKAFNNSPVWVVLSSFETGRYIEVNETYLQDMGCRREDVLGRTSLEIDSWVNPDDRRAIQARLEEQGAVRNMEVARRTRTGRIMTMLFSSEIIEVAGEACMLSVSLDISDRKRSEEQLRLSEDNLRITLDSIGDAVIATDVRGRITRLNPMAARLTGWTPAEAEHRPLQEVFHIVNAHTRHKVEDPAAKVLALGKLVGLANHTVLIARDGREYQIADSAAPISGADGRIVGVVLVFRDVTEAYLQEHRIREQQATLERITANIPGIVYQLYARPNHEYGMRYVSEKAGELFGLGVPLERFFDTLIRNLTKAEQAELFASLHNAAATLTPWQYEGRFITAAGATRWYSCNAVPHRDDGEVIFDGVLMDITAIKTAQEEILQRRRFLESVLYHAPDAIVTLDEAHRVIDWNPGAVQMFGYTSEEAFGQPLDELVAHGDAARQAGEKTRQVLAGKRVEAFETVRYRKDGSPVHVIAAGSPILVDGRLKGVVAVYTNITKQKAIEKERQDYEIRIQQMQKMEAIGMLAGGIAHDFNNILSAVLGYAELALIDTPEDSPVHKNIRQIHAAGVRARDLVKQILAFSRQDEKELKPLQIGSQIKEALKMLRSSLPTTIDITAHIDPAVDNVMADPTQIHQIVMNLCTNAAQAMEEDGGRLTVSLSQTILTDSDVRLHPGLGAGRYAQLRVQDTGTGIPADILDKIFQPYFTTKEKDKGTGLGLAVVHGIVQSYGGDIRVDSAPGEGTTFDIYLPTIKAPAESTASPTAMPRGDERILLVDDETVIVDIGRQSLERLGYRVESCTSSIEALERFQRDPDRFDLVVTDMTMPTLTGDQLARELLSLRPDIPVILCTGYSSRIDSRQAKALGIRAMLMKPLNLHDLARHVRRILDGIVEDESV
jgi:PAS domain S-box-containing protein